MAKIPTEVKKYIFNEWENKIDELLESEILNKFNFKMSASKIKGFRQRNSLKKQEKHRQILKTCPYCGKDFKTYYSRQKTCCSDWCAKKYRKKTNMQKLSNTITDKEIRNFFIKYKTYIYDVIQVYTKYNKYTFVFDDIFSDINYRSLNIISVIKNLPEKKQKSYIKMCILNVIKHNFNLRKREDFIIYDDELLSRL